MRLTEIEARLGPDATCRIQDGVFLAYRTAGAQAEGVRALRALLVAMLATVVTTERHLAVAEQLAAEDAAQLNALVRKIKEIAKSGLSAPDPGVHRATSDPCSAPSERRLVALGMAARRRTLPFGGRAAPERPRPARST